MILTKKNIFVPEWNQYDENDWFLVNYSSGRFGESRELWTEDSFNISLTGEYASIKNFVNPKYYVN